MFQDATEKGSTLLSFAKPMSSHADAPRLRAAWPNGRVEHIDRVGAFVMGVCKRTLLAWRSGEGRRSDLFERFGPDRVRQARIEDPDARLPEDRFRWLEAAPGLAQST